MLRRAEAPQPYPWCLGHINSGTRFQLPEEPLAPCYETQQTIYHGTCQGHGRSSSENYHAIRKFLADILRRRPGYDRSPRQVRALVQNLVVVLFSSAVSEECAEKPLGSRIDLPRASQSALESHVKPGGLKARRFCHTTGSDEECYCSGLTV